MNNINNTENINSCYLVADYCFKVHGAELVTAVERIGGFKNFKTAERQAGFHFRLYTEENLSGSENTTPATDKLLYTSETDGVVFKFYTQQQEGHLLEMEHEDGSRLYAWSRPAEQSIYLKGSLTVQMLRFAMWIGYGLMTLGSNRIAIHGSCIVKDGRAYLFLGESGTGKSTHTRLWRENIPGAELLNDDSPIILAENDAVYIYGSPWSGKTPCYKQEHYPLGGCVRLSQAPFNEISRLSKLKAYAALHPSCPPEFAYDTALYDNLSNSINNILLNVPFYHLKCLPNAEAAQLSFKTLSAMELY